MLKSAALVLTAVLALSLFVAMPAWSSTGGVGSQNLQASDCSAHGTTSPATIAMSSSATSVAPGQQMTVSVTVSGGTSVQMGVALLSKTTGSTGTTPQENGWTIVTDPVGSQFNYVETDYTGSLTDTWTMNAPATAGTYKLYAKIFHGSAAYVKLYSTGITITVTAPTVNPPTVSITAPTSGSTVTGSIAVSATVTPAAGETIARAELMVDGTLVGTLTAAPFTWTLDTTKYANGQHTLSVTGYDGGGRSGSAQITVTTSNTFTPPSVTITAPAAGGTVGGVVSVTATVTPGTSQTITKVDLLVDGVSVGSDTASPYAWSWDTNVYTNAAHTLTVTATDGGGLSGSAQTSVTVYNAPTPPVVSITSPANGAQVSGIITVTASATGTGGRTITSVSMTVDGTAIGTDTVSPYAWSLNTYLLTNAVHTIIVTAVDGAGQSASAQITINVDNSAPAISGIVPADGTVVSGTVEIRVNATAASGSPTVTLLIDGTSYGPLSAPPYAWSIDTTKLADGTHELTFQAVDAKGNMTQATSTLLVSNQGPSIVLISPTDLTGVSGEVTFSSNATSLIGVVRSSMYMDDVLVNESASGDNKWTVDTIVYDNGVHRLSVVAQDALGRNATRTFEVTFNNSLAQMTMIGEQELSGIVEVGISITGTEKVLNATLSIDGVAFESLNGEPFLWTVDTYGLVDGEHRFNVTAITEGNRTLTASMVVSVENAAPATNPLLEFTTVDTLFLLIAAAILAVGVLMKKKWRSRP